MGITVFAQRLRWYRHALGMNPLIRATDRLEALAVLAVFVAALFALPVSAQAGSEIYDAGVRTADEQAHSRHSVTAVALEGTTSMPTDFYSPDAVRAQWRDGMQVHTGSVVTPGTVNAGESLTIWLDPTGKVVAAPLTPADAKLSAVGGAGTLWVVLVVCSALLAFGVRRVLDRLRDRAWERELHLLANNDDGWANRYT